MEQIALIDKKLRLQHQRWRDLPEGALKDLVGFMVEDLQDQREILVIKERLNGSPADKAKLEAKMDTLIRNRNDRAAKKQPKRKTPLRPDTPKEDKPKKP